MNLPQSKIKEIMSIVNPISLKYSPFTPTPKQQAFMSLRCGEALYGGQVGGGKTITLAMDALQYVHIKGYSCILFRKTLADLDKAGAWIPELKKWLLPFDNVQWRDKAKRFEFFEMYGRKKEIISTVQFGYLETDNHRFNYDGGEYQRMYFDELIHISRVNYEYMQTRLRRKQGVNIPIASRAASNPPPPGMGVWVYNKFVNPKTKDLDTIFLPAGLSDNPYIDEKEYRKRFVNISEMERNRLLNGLWTIEHKGEMFNRDDFEFVDILPKGMPVVRYWDMAATEKKKGKDPDYTVGVKVGMHRGIYYILDIERFRKNPENSQIIQKRLALRDGKRCKIYMEQEGGSSGVIAIDFYKTNIFDGFYFKGIKSTGNKVERAKPVSILAEQQKIKIWSKLKQREDILDEFFTELEGFPEVSHDDQVDALSGAIAQLPYSNYSASTSPIVVDGSESYWRLGE